MRTLTEVQWEFGGWLRGASPAGGWLLLALALAIGLTVAHVSYRRTADTLTPARRRALFLLRAVFCAGLAFCLANPTRVERRVLDDAGRQPLAVVIDRSESMTTPDNRGRSRLDSALRAWEAVRADAERHFGKISFHTFAKHLTPAATLDEALAAREDDGETMLFDSLAAALAAAPAGGYGGILCLTDGVDTSSKPSGALLSSALGSRTPLYFLPGENRLRARSFLEIREIDVPAQIIRRAKFQYGAVIEAHTDSEGRLPVKLMADGKVVASETLELEPGRNLFSWSREIEAGEAGAMRLELHAGAGAGKKIAVHAVRVAEKVGVDLLYYQGALDWGFHFLNVALERDPSFRVAAVFNPALGARIRSGAAGDAARDLPASAQALAKYQVVVLANVFASQLSAAQQRALEEYTRAGGGLLFILPNDEAAMAFAGSPLEAMLPVVFERPSARTTREFEAERFQQTMRQTGDGANIRLEGDFARGAQAATDRDPLTPFAFPEKSPLAGLLRMRGAAGEERIVPKFADYAKVQRAKPGAEILAVHPTAKSGQSGEPRILLATQTFGKGRASVLSTDSLWRWRMSLPSDSREAATFWQQLLLWLAQSSSRGGIQFIEKFTEAPLNQIVTLTLAAGAAAPAVAATGPDGQTTPLPVKAGAEAGQWQVVWTPAQAGLWEINARVGASDAAQRFLSVVDKPEAARDLANLPPAIDLMRELAAATGGGIVQSGAPAAWKAAAAAGARDAQVLSERRELIWNNWWLLLGCFSAYAAELLLRRRWQLI